MHTMLGDAIMDTLHRATRNGFTVRFADLSEGVWITIIDLSRERETSLFLTPENYERVMQRLEMEYAYAAVTGDIRANNECCCDVLAARSSTQIANAAFTG